MNSTILQDRVPKKTTALYGLYCFLLISVSLLGLVEVSIPGFSLSTFITSQFSTKSLEHIDLPNIENLQSTQSNSIQENTRIEGKPIRLTLPSQNIDLEIIDGEYEDNKWTLTRDKAQYATITPILNNEAGNTLIYGHNTPAVFNPTKDLKVGDYLYIYSETHIFIYSYHSDKLVLPTDTTIFNELTGPQVTLLTCNGWTDQYRRLMFFKLEGVMPK
jgi:LPXTG-site transpeptidase (sortase) family protein